jgi:hypothetical protein
VNLQVSRGTRPWWVVVGCLVAVALVAASLFFHNLDALFSPSVDTTPVHLPRNPALARHASVAVEQGPVQVVARPDRAALKIVREVVGPGAEVRVEGPDQAVRIVEKDPATGSETVRTLGTLVQSPPAPWGGDIAVTIGEAGDLGATFKPRARPLFGLGGESALGAELDLDGRLSAYVRQDLLRVGKFQGYAKAWASFQEGGGIVAAPAARQRGLDYGAGVGVELRLGHPK